MHLWDALTTGAARSSLYGWSGSDFEASSWADVVAGAHEIAVGLRRLGVRSGTCVAVILGNSPRAVQGMLGVWLAGGVIALVENGDRIRYDIPERTIDLVVDDTELERRRDAAQPCDARSRRHPFRRAECRRNGRGQRVGHRPDGRTAGDRRGDRGNS